MQRIAQVIGLDHEAIGDYERHHAAVWPGVLATIRACNIRDYSIYRYGDLLFATYTYVGADLDADMARMAADPETQRWWAIMRPIQRPVPEATDGEWWHDLSEVFHTSTE